ncbi:MAG: tRNA (adenosine(37)-N6)-threonylcarbamoyltransferase complex transferase subunit TsaD [Candidatus Levyibacteriota bacterium]
MLILGIETSCDETSAAIVEDGTKVLSNVISSSLPLHVKTGGIIPEVAARQQIKYIIPAINQALLDAFDVGSEKWDLDVLKSRNLDVKNSRSKISHLSRLISKIDAIAVTVGPGLIGSLLVGVETAKTLAYVWKKPIIPVNHLIGHIYANFVSEISNFKFQISNSSITFPALVLIVSGGHTDLLLMKNHEKLKWLGGTRDDAAGEAFDKIARLLGLPYPGGPIIEQKAKNGNPKAFNFPRPMIDSNDFDFSFSGLKTAVLRETKTIKQLSNETIANLSASTQQAIVDILVAKTLKAAKEYNVKSILLSGGVSANDKLREQFQLDARRYLLDANIFYPDKKYCTDNAAMIASAAFFNYKPLDWRKITANPELYFI